MLWDRGGQLLLIVSNSTGCRIEKAQHDLSLREKSAPLSPGSAAVIQLLNVSNSTAGSRDEE